MNQTSTSIVAKNTTYQFVAKAVTMLLSVITFALMARSLTEGQYGQFTIISTIFALMVGFSDLKVEQIVVREAAKDDDQLSILVSQSTWLKVLFSLSVSVVTLALVLVSSYSNEIKLGVTVVLLGVLLNSFSSGFQSLIQHHLKAYLLTLAEVVAKVIAVILVLVVFWLGSKSSISTDLILLWYVVIAFIVSPFIMWMCYAFWSFRQFNYRIKFELSSDIARSLAREAWPLWFMGLFALLHYRLGTIILSAFQPEYDVGIFGLAYRFLDVVVTLPPLFIASVYPIISRYIAHDPDRAKQILVKSFNFMLIFVVMLAVGTYYAAPQIVALFGDGGYLEAVGVLRILTITMISSYLSSIIVAFLIAVRAQKYAMLISGFSVLINLILNFALIPSYSFDGAAWSIAISELIGFILFAYIGVVRFGIRLEWGVFMKVIFSGTIMLLALWLTGWNKVSEVSLSQTGGYLLLIGVSGFVVYGLCIWLLRVVDQDILKESMNNIPAPQKLKRMIHG